MSQTSNAIRLTDVKIRSLKPPPRESVPPQQDYRDVEARGLVLRVFASGKRVWLTRLRVPVEGARKLVWVHLGHYPETTLSQAREKTRHAQAQARAGKDPREDASISAKKQREQTQEQSRDTFGHFASEFLEKHVTGLRASTRREYERTLKGPRQEESDERAHPWHARPITQITKRDVLELIEGMVDRGSPIQANRQLAYLKRFFAWCAERDLIETVPTDRIRPPAKNNHRERALSNAEVLEVYRAIVEDPGRKQGGLFRALLAILLLTGQRREEVAGMRWSELKGLDGAAPLWEIPGERTKNHRPHIVPLASQVVVFLRSLPQVLKSDLVFTTTGETSISGFSRAKLRVDEAITKAREKAGNRESIPAWTIHDLRRTVSTRMHEDLGIQPHIVEAVLNHVSGARAGVAGTYNRALYLDDKRRALEAWANHVDALVSGAAREASNVVPIVGARGARR